MIPNSNNLKLNFIFMIIFTELNARQITFYFNNLNSFTNQVILNYFNLSNIHFTLQIYKQNY